MGLGYLFCRAADTIADTRLIPRSQRMKYLDMFREQFEERLLEAPVTTQIQSVLQYQKDHPSERLLLSKLEDCFAWYHSFDGGDRELLRGVVLGVIQGMQMDLTFFAGEDESQLAALPTLKELDEYCWFIGGCPGIFWTKLCFQHLPSLRKIEREGALRKGTEFGKGLQMTNILRDLAKDLRNGRCYIPQTELERQGLSPRDLLRMDAWPRLEPVYRELIAKTGKYLDEGFAYILELPRREIRLRMACAWPLLAALKTLARLARSHEVLDPRKTIKITRPELYKLMAASTAAAPSNTALTQLYRAIR
jgi:farnesyl-diphosphate farnesyltransferase